MNHTWFHWPHALYVYARFLEKCENTQEEKFLLDLAAFVVKYEMNRTQPDINLVKSIFREGDMVEIIKESNNKGRIVRVVDPCWNGLVKVECDDRSIKSYLPNNLLKRDTL